jgi:hypothetical protein
MINKTTNKQSQSAFKICTVSVPIVGTSPLSFGRHHQMPKLNENESPDLYERRTFREKTHYDHQTGEVFIPPMCFKKSLEEAPAFLNLGTIPEKKGATYNKFFLSAIMITDRVYIGCKIDEAREEVFFVNPQGKKNAGTRVQRWFATFDNWGGTLTTTILNADILTPEIFERGLIGAGIFVGVGRFRPQNRGFYGRFKPTGEFNYEDVII